MGNLSRRGFVRLGLAGAASPLLGSFLGACGSGNGAGAGIGKGGNTINTGNTGSQAAQVVIAMNTGSEPAAGFDPLVAWGAGEHVHEPLIQSTLVTTDTGLGFANDLATSYSCSEDGMSWTFTIRDDVRFTDGMPLTAHDVAFTLNGIRESEAAQADLSMVAGVLAQDDRTVHITMAKPFNALLYTLAVIGIVPAHAYGKDYGSKPLGSGRYLLEQWDKGQQVILAANPGYYGEKPRMQRVVVVFMEEDAALAAVRSGQVDIAFTSAVFSGQIIAGYDLFSCKTVDCRGISLPVVPPGNSKADGPNSYPAGNEVTCDRAIRQALNYALDRETMIRNVLSGHGTPAYSVADTLPWASPAMKVETDTAYAQSLLERAGWDLGSDGIRSKGGKRAAFSLVYPAGDSVRQALAAEFANQMKGIGIEVTPKGLGWDDIYPREFCDPILWGWGSHSPAELYELIYSSGWGNFACHESAATDRYLDEALAAADIKDSWDLWQKAQWDGEQGIAPQGAASWVWLANIDHLYFKRTALDVADQKPHPHGHGWSLVNNVDRWAWHD